MYDIHFPGAPSTYEKVFGVGAMFGSKYLEEVRLEPQGLDAFRRHAWFFQVTFAHPRFRPQTGLFDGSLTPTGPFSSWLRCADHASFPSAS